MRNRKPLQSFMFGKQRVKTKVSVMVPEGVGVFEVDVANFLKPTKRDPMADAIWD